MVVMGGFMAAGAYAALHGGKKRTDKTSQTIPGPKQGRYGLPLEAERQLLEEENRRKRACLDAETKLGRAETEEERVDREIKEFGFSFPDNPWKAGL